jgi:hypothetical protein
MGADHSGRARRTAPPPVVAARLPGAAIQDSRVSGLAGEAYFLADGAPLIA